MTDLRRSVLKRLAKLPSLSKETRFVSPWWAKVLRFQPARMTSYETENFKRLEPVFGASESQVAKPRALDETPHILSLPLPPIRPMVFENVAVYPECSVLKLDHMALVTNQHIENSARFKLENRKSCSFEYEGTIYFPEYRKKYLPKAISASAHGATNWYHWLIEVLPIVMLAQNLPSEFDDYPLLVPKEAIDRPNFRDTLELFVGSREVVAHPPKTQFIVSNLIFIPPPVSGPFNLHPGHWPEPGDYVQNIDVMRQFRANILNRLGIKHDGSGPSRIFLARPGDRRSFNQDEIIAAAKARGFEIVRPETLTFREQVQLFHNADHIVGPTGAAFTNILFTRPDTPSLIWALEPYNGACFFSNLAHVAGNQMTYYFVNAEREIKGTEDAFSASYTLPIDEFERHLDAILASRATGEGSMSGT